MRTNPATCPLLAPCIGVLLGLAFAEPAAALTPEFHELGVLPGGTYFTSAAHGLSADGEVVVGTATTWFDIPD